MLLIQTRLKEYDIYFLLLIDEDPLFFIFSAFKHIQSFILFVYMMNNSHLKWMIIPSFISFKKEKKRIKKKVSYLCALVKSSSFFDTKISVR
jgi:hypothetical protein